MDLLLLVAPPPPEMEVSWFSRTSFFFRLSRNSLALTPSALGLERDWERDRSRDVGVLSLEWPFLRLRLGSSSSLEDCSSELSLSLSDSAPSLVCGVCVSWTCSLGVQAQSPYCSLLGGLGRRLRRCPTLDRSVFVVARLVRRIEVTVAHVHHIKRIAGGSCRFRFAPLVVQYPVGVGGRVLLERCLAGGFLLVERGLDESLVDVGVDAALGRRVFELPLLGGWCLRVWLPSRRRRGCRPLHELHSQKSRRDPFRSFWRHLG